MKAFNYIISICMLFLLNACNHPDLDIQFNKESDIVIPAEGGSYFFEAEAIEFIKTKTVFIYFLRAFEYRVIVGENIIEQQLVQFERVNEYIEPGDKFKVDFKVPENLLPEERSVRVDILLAKDRGKYDPFYGNDDHVDSGDNTWETVWEAIQLAY